MLLEGLIAFVIVVKIIDFFTFGWLLWPFKK